VLVDTRLEGERHGANVVFITDPDGTRIELVQGDFDPERLGG
jgi:hypothetical protein